MKNHQSTFIKSADHIFISEQFVFFFSWQRGKNVGVKSNPATTTVIWIKDDRGDLGYIKGAGCRTYF